MPNFDAVVVGAGPAGCAAAVVLAEGGASVALIERATFPRDKICGDAISPGSVELLQRLKFLPAVLAAGAYPISGIRFIAPDRTETLPRNPAVPGYVLARRQLDEALFRSVQGRGVHTFEATRLVGLTPGHKLRVRLANGHEEEWDAPYVIGADGEHSAVRQQVGLQPNSARHRAYAIRYYATDVDGLLDNAMEIDCWGPLLPGYGWIFPMPDGLVNVGVGMLARYLHRTHKPLTRLLSDWVQKSSHRFGRVQQLSKPQGWPLSMGSRRLRRAGPGWLLCGDAASLVDPITGEGIHTALHSGEMAALSILRYPTRPEQVASSYIERCDRAYGGHLRMASRLQGQLTHPSMSNRLIGSARRHPDLALDLLGVFGGMLPCTALLRPAGLWRFLC